MFEWSWNRVYENVIGAILFSMTDVSCNITGLKNCFKLHSESAFGGVL